MTTEKIPTDEQIDAKVQEWFGDDAFAKEGLFNIHRFRKFARALLSASIADTAGAKPIYQVRPRNGEEWTDVSENEYHISGGAGYLQRIVYAAPPAPSVADAPCEHEWQGMTEPHKECMKCGDVRRDWTSVADAAGALTDSDVFTLIGHANILRDHGESDMPSWILDLAQRIARKIDPALADRVADIAKESQ